MEIFDFLVGIPYLTTALTILTATHALAVAVVNLTPTPTDDAWVATIYKYVEWAAGIVTSKAKQ